MTSKTTVWDDAWNKTKMKIKQKFTRWFRKKCALINPIHPLWILFVCHTERLSLETAETEDNHGIDWNNRIFLKTNPIKYIGFISNSVAFCSIIVNNPQQERLFVIPFILRSFFPFSLHVLIILKTGMLTQVWLIALPWQQTYNHVTTPHSLSFIPSYQFLLLYFLYTNHTSVTYFSSYITIMKVFGVEKTVEMIEN